MRAKKYINAFLYFFISAGVLTGFLGGIRAGFWSGVQFGLLFAISLTVLAALIILPLDFFFTKNLANSELAVRQTDELKVEGNVGDVFQKSLQILLNIRSIKTIQPITAEMAIAAKTRPSLFSFGERIRLQFVASDGGQVRIQISSETILSYTKIDYGKNLKNVKSIGKAISENFKTAGAVVGSDLGRPTTPTRGQKRDRESFSCQRVPSRCLDLTLYIYELRENGTFSISFRSALSERSPVNAHLKLTLVRSAQFDPI